jgi:hypothetical protein
MAPAVLGFVLVALASPAWGGVEHCLSYADNRTVAACVEREGGPVPARRTTTPAANRSELRPSVSRSDVEMPSVRVIPVKREVPVPPPPQMSVMETTVRSMNWWFFIIPGVAVLVIMLQLAGRATYGRASSYVPLNGRRAGMTPSSGPMGALMGQLAGRYRRCPYCGARAGRRSSVCKKCLRALPT